MLRPIIAIVLLGLCTSTTLAESAKPIKVGVIVPLTGPLAEFGVATQHGIQMAQSDEHALLKEVHFIYEDSQYNPQTATTIFRKLTSDPDVKLVINFGCPTSQAIAPLAEQKKVPTILFCSALLLTKGRAYSFAASSPANEWAAILQRYLFRKGFKKICLLLTQNDYLVSEFHALQAEIEHSKAGQSITVIDQFTPQETDFRSTIPKLRSSGCDALGVYLLPGQVRTFFTQAASLKPKPQIFGSDIFESIEEIKASQGGLEDAVFVNLAVPPEFKNRYVSQYKNENQLTSACVFYDLTLRVAPLLAEKDQASGFMERLSQSAVQNGKCGRSEFVRVESGEQFVRFPLVLKEIRNGAIEERKSPEEG